MYKKTMENNLDGRRTFAGCLAEIINADVINYKTDGIYDLHSILEAANSGEYVTFVLLTRKSDTHLFDILMNETSQKVYESVLGEAIGKYFIYVAPGSIKIQQFFKKGDTENE